MTKLIGFGRPSTRQQCTDRQQADLLAAGVRHDDLYVDHGVFGARASRTPSSIGLCIDRPSDNAFAPRDLGGRSRYTVVSQFHANAR